MGADCKSVAKATKVRILDPPHARRTAPDLLQRGQGPFPSHPTQTHRIPLRPTCHPKCAVDLAATRLGRSTVSAVSSADLDAPDQAPGQPRPRSSVAGCGVERGLYTALGRLLLAVDAFGVDLEQDVHAVPGPLCDLCPPTTSRATRVQQTGRDGGTSSRERACAGHQGSAYRAQGTGGCVIQAAGDEPRECLGRQPQSSCIGSDCCCLLPIQQLKRHALIDRKLHAAGRWVWSRSTHPHGCAGGYRQAG
jgi:hypothetical protein